MSRRRAFPRQHWPFDKPIELYSIDISENIYVQGPSLMILPLALPPPKSKTNLIGVEFCGHMNCDSLHARQSAHSTSLTGPRHFGVMATAHARTFEILTATGDQGRHQ